MADIVNLRRFKREKARAANAADAKENRVRFGRSKADRHRVKIEVDANVRHAEGHRLVPSDTTGLPSSRASEKTPKKSPENPQ